MRWLWRRVTYANVVASVALFLALSGGAYAVAGNPFIGHGDAISVCVQAIYGELQVARPGAMCPKGDVRLALNAKGRPGPAGPRGAVGPRGLPGAPGAGQTRGRDILMTLSANKNLSSMGGAFTSVLTVQLPESSNGTQYVLAAQGDLVNFGPSDYTRCDIRVNGREVAAVSTIVGSPSGSGTNGPASYLSPFSLTGGANVPAAGGTARLRCWHDETNGATPYVNDNTSIWAHQTGSLTTGTQ